MNRTIPLLLAATGTFLCGCALFQSKVVDQNQVPRDNNPAVALRVDTMQYTLVFKDTSTRGRFLKKLDTLSKQFSTDLKPAKKYKPQDVKPLISASPVKTTPVRVPTKSAKLLAAFGFPLDLKAAALDFLLLQWEPARVACVFPHQLLIFEKTKEAWKETLALPFERSLYQPARDPVGLLWQESKILHAVSSAYTRGLSVPLDGGPPSATPGGFDFPDPSGKPRLYSALPDRNYFKEEPAGPVFYQKFAMPPCQIAIDADNSIRVADENGKTLTRLADKVGSTGCVWKNYLFVTAPSFLNSDYFRVYEWTQGTLTQKSVSELYPGNITAMHVYEKDGRPVMLLSLSQSGKGIIITQDVEKLL